MTCPAINSIWKIPFGNHSSARPEEFPFGVVALKDRGIYINQDSRMCSFCQKVRCIKYGKKDAFHLREEQRESGLNFLVLQSDQALRTITTSSIYGMRQQNRILTFILQL